MENLIGKYFMVKAGELGGEIGKCTGQYENESGTLCVVLFFGAARLTYALQDVREVASSGKCPHCGSRKVDVEEDMTLIACRNCGRSMLPAQGRTFDESDIEARWE